MMITLQMRLTNKGKGSMLMSITDTMITEQMEKDRKERTMNTAKRMIWVTFRKEGIHKYPAALDDPKLATGGWDDVSFLGYPHRHIFHFKVAIAVTHNDRDIHTFRYYNEQVQLYNSTRINISYELSKDYSNN